MTKRDELILEHKVLAEKLAYRLKRTLPKYISVEELNSAAYLGLIMAAHAFNPEIQESFLAYAKIKIFGSMYDYLRELRGSRRQGIKIEYLETDIEDTHCFEFNDLFEVVTKDLDVLDKQIVEMYYIEGYTMKEIGDSIGKNESNVSQRLTRSRLKMKRYIEAA